MGEGPFELKRPCVAIFVYKRSIKSLQIRIRLSSPSKTNLKPKAVLERLALETSKTELLEQHSEGGT